MYIVSFMRDWHRRMFSYVLSGLPSAQLHSSEDADEPIRFTSLYMEYHGLKTYEDQATIALGKMRCTSMVAYSGRAAQSKKPSMSWKC